MNITSKNLLCLAKGLLLLAGISGCAQADSPLTSTDFYTAYQDIEAVQRAAAQKEIDPEILGFLSSPANPIDVKAAVVNALSWDITAAQNARSYRLFLHEFHQAGGEEELLDKLSADELLCLGYLTALGNYFEPDSALPWLRAAREKNPASLTVSLILALTEAQIAMDTDWCRVWRLGEAVFDDPRLTPDIRPEAVGIVKDYLILYKDYCDPETLPGTRSAEGKDPCENARTQAELNECAARQFRDADEDLAHIYNEIAASLSPGILESLEAEQSAWMQLREAHCDSLASEYEGGSIYPLMYYNCLREMVENRITELRMQFPD